MDPIAIIILSNIFTAGLNTIIEMLTKPAKEITEKAILSDYRKGEQDSKLIKAFIDAAKDANINNRDNEWLQSVLFNLTIVEDNALRDEVAATVMKMFRKEDLSNELLKKLGISVSKRDRLAEFLYFLRRRLVTINEYANYIYFENDAEAINRLSRIEKLILKDIEVTIDNNLLTVLEFYKNSCQKNQIPFFTPHLFLALLDIHNGITQRALNQIKPELAAELRESLIKYITKVLPANTNEPFREFDWTEREDIKMAGKLALESNYNKITEKYILLGMLQTKSKTVMGLYERLGGNDFEKLLEIVKSMPDEDFLAPYVTPGPEPFAF